MRATILERNRGKRFTRQKFSENQKYKGVIFFLYDMGCKNPEEAQKVIIQFCAFAGIELPKKRKFIYACCHIQENFRVFLKWYYARYNNSSGI